MNVPKFLLVIVSLAVVFSMAWSVGYINNDNTPIPSGSIVPCPADANTAFPQMNYPDKFAWQLFVKVNKKSPDQLPIVVNGDTVYSNSAVWETWADDQLTFPENPDTTNPPQWPESYQHHKRLIKGVASGFHRENSGPILDTGGEEVHRNKVTFDYIIDNNLWYTQGIAAFFANAKATGAEVRFPEASIEVKGNWVSIEIEDTSRYHWNYDESGNVFGLVAMHISSKDLPNWFWCTFEWVDNPGRCDYIGCHDCFGIEEHTIASHPDTLGKQYPAGTLTEELKQLFQENGFTGAWGDGWKNYRLKGSMTDYISPTGRPLLLGNSVTESGFVPTASCITCHGRAAVNAEGKSSFPIFGEKKSLPLEQVPQLGETSTTTFITYNGAPDPNWFYKFTGNGAELTNLQTDFVWAIPFQAKPIKH